MKKILCFGLITLVTTAHAHVVIDPPVAEAGSYYRAALKVPHGCNGSPITQIVAYIPPGVQRARPMPKAGWRLEIETAKLDKSYVSHGRTISEDVSVIRWIAKTPDDYLLNEHYDEFVIAAKLPETPGRMYWKTTQICVDGRVDWHQVADGKGGVRQDSPAPMLEVKPAAGHQHGSHGHKH